MSLNQAFNRRDLQALLALYDPDCEWHLSHYEGWPERDIYLGRDGLSEFFDTWLSPWESFHFEIKEMVDLAGNGVLVTGYGHGYGRLSGWRSKSPPLAQIMKFRGERLWRVDNYSDVEEGRRAAGLSE